jgi:hypothetical protein
LKDLLCRKSKGIGPEVEKMGAATASDPDRWAELMFPDGQATAPIQAIHKTG